MTTLQLENPKREDIDRYLEIVEWARQHYKHKGRLMLIINGQRSPYTLLEEAAWQLYMS